MKLAGHRIIMVNVWSRAVNERQASLKFRTWSVRMCFKESSRVVPQALLRPFHLFATNGCII